MRINSYVKLEKETRELRRPQGLNRSAHASAESTTNERSSMALRRQLLLNGTTGVQPGNQTRYAFSNSPAPPLTANNYDPNSPDLHEHDGWTATSGEETEDEGILNTLNLLELHVKQSFLQNKRGC